jgi:nicotinamide-nucleotide amidase
VNIELINTGTELLNGKTLNSHQQWIGDRLSRHGYTVARQITIPDTAESISVAVDEALARVDIVITTGGLGPTSDDLTREAIAELLGLGLTERAEIRTDISDRFQRLRKTPPDSVYVQAMVPEGAEILPNDFGTAPGLAIRSPKTDSWLLMLPGPPRELQPMVDRYLLPFLRDRKPITEGFAGAGFKVSGLGESRVQDALTPQLEEQISRGLAIAYCARIGEVDLRFTARGAEAESLVEHARNKALHLLGEWIFTDDEEELENVIVRLLTERNETLAIAESCTGGFISNRITNAPGASAVLLAGAVTYSNASKVALLGVSSETLDQHGAVSEDIAREMAEGARRITGADYALSTTGIAGPSGGSEAKPVGTVFIGLAGPAGTIVTQSHNAFDRETFKSVTCQQALTRLFQEIRT